MQNDSLEPGEHLEFKLKGPRSHVFIAGSGKIVWKEKANKFACVLGIKLREGGEGRGSKMLEIITAAMVPFESGLFGTVPDKSTAENMSDAQFISQETAEALRKNVVQMKTGNPPMAKNRNKKKWLYVTTFTTIAVALVYLTFGNIKNGFDGSVPKSKKLSSQSVPTQELLQSDQLQIPQEKSGGIVVEHEGKIQSGQPPSAAGMGENIKYLIQVGAWNNPRHARDMLTRLDKYYPDAYIVVENNFHKLRIPNVLTKAQGNKIIREIERTYHLRPLLLRKGRKKE